jgi:tetratricopeptide (TPR) repeat protein
VTGSLLARNFREAVAWTERARTIAYELDDERLRIEALAQHAVSTFFAGDAGAGIRFAEEALERARALGDDGLLGLPYVAYLLCLDELDPEATEGLFTESIACTERSGDLLIHCILLNNAGVHALRIGDTAAARRYLEEGIEMAEKMGHADSHLGVNLGWTMLEMDDPVTARAHFEAALRLSRLQGDLADVACSIVGMSCLCADTGEWRRASTLIGIADDLFQGIGLAWPEPEISHRNRSAERIVENIGTEGFDSAHAQGEAFSLEEAFDYCLNSSATV